MSTRGTPPPDRDTSSTTAWWIIGALVVLVIVVVAGWGGLYEGYWGGEDVAGVEEVEPEEDVGVE